MCLATRRHRHPDRRHATGNSMVAWGSCGKGVGLGARVCEQGWPAELAAVGGRRPLGGQGWGYCNGQRQFDQRQLLLADRRRPVGCASEGP